MASLVLPFRYKFNMSFSWQNIPVGRSLHYVSSYWRNEIGSVLEESLIVKDIVGFMPIQAYSHYLLNFFFCLGFIWWACAHTDTHTHSIFRLTRTVVTVAGIGPGQIQEAASPMCVARAQLLKPSIAALSGVLVGSWIRNWAAGI